MAKYRHEFKYMMDAPCEGLVLAKAKALLQSDGNVDEDGRYIVRSLYFDDMDSTCLYENINGTDNRSKFRIRYYNGDMKFLRLEKKSKSHGMTLKESCRISEDEFWKLFQGKSIGISGDETKNKVVADFLGKGMRPRVIVTYERIPFIYKPGNVRVTFDRNLGASTQVDRFLAGDYRQRPVFELGKSLLEVKFDEYLPVHIKAALQTNGLQWTTFSKYYMCCMNKV